jgi:protein-serine/threonine kinase
MQQQNNNEKRDRRYPPVSMKNAMPQADEATPRPSTESRRRPSFSFTRKNSDQAPSERRSSRRFSFLPASFSMNNFGGGKKENGYDSDGMNGRRDSMQGGRPQSKGMAFGRGSSRSPSQDTTNSTIPLYYDADREAGRQQRRSGVPQGMPQGRQQVDPRFEKALPPQPGQQINSPQSPVVQRKQFRDDGFGSNRLDNSSPAHAQQEPVERFYTPNETLDQRVQPQQQPRQDQYNVSGALPRPNASNNYLEPEFAADDGYGSNQTQPLNASGAQNIRPNQRKFDAAYEQGHGGSSSGARRVMDFFRRRGKDRSQI